MKKQTKIALLILLTVCIGALIVRMSGLWPQFAVSEPAITPTQQISSDTSIGGIPTEKPKSEEKPVPNPAEHTVSEQPTPQPISNDLAPKQTEITESVEKEYPYYALGTSNDPLTQSSWALANTKAHAAWDRSTGSSVVVAVIDSGFALTHEDLIEQWSINVDEQGQTTSGSRCWSGIPTNKANNGCDDDGNGYIDDWRGWDFVGRTNNPQAGRTNPTGNGVAHGTEVAGLVGATGNNGKGIATYGWNTKLMPLQVLSDDGSGYTSSVVAAIYYAVDEGAAIINMSLGGPDPDPALEAAINYAYERNVLVVAAAGNCGTGNEFGCNPAQPGAMGYPALNRNVIAVGATTSSNTRASFSSYGPALDVVAPGSGAIVSTMWTPTNQTSAYASSLYGTSFASPMVAGYAALLKSVRPSTTVDDLSALISGTSNKVGAMNGAIYTDQYGHGLIDAQRVLTVASSLNTSSYAPTHLQTGSEKSEHTFATSSSLSSGCTTQSDAYCTIWAKDSTGYERYLPYTLSSGSGAGWSWSGSTLGRGQWQLYARSGTFVSSTPYLLFQK